VAQFVVVLFHSRRQNPEKGKPRTPLSGTEKGAGANARGGAYLKKARRNLQASTQGCGRRRTSRGMRGGLEKECCSYKKGLKGHQGDGLKIKTVRSWLRGQISVIPWREGRGSLSIGNGTSINLDGPPFDLSRKENRGEKGTERKLKRSRSASLRGRVGEDGGGKLPGGDISQVYKSTSWAVLYGGRSSGPGAEMGLFWGSERTDAVRSLPQCDYLCRQGILL